MIEQRGLALTDTQRERIDSCESHETLQAWFRAVNAATANQPLDDLLS